MKTNYRLLETIVDKLLHDPTLTLQDIKKEFNVTVNTLISFIDYEYKYRSRAKYYDIKYRLSSKFETDLKIKNAFEKFLNTDESFSAVMTSCNITENTALKRLQDTTFTTKNIKLSIDVGKRLKETGVVDSNPVDLINKAVLMYFEPKTKFSVFNTIQKGLENIYLDFQDILSSEMYGRFLIADKSKKAELLELNKACFRATYNNTTIEEELELSPIKPDVEKIDYGYLRFCSPCLITVLKESKKSNSIKSSPLLRNILNKTAIKSEWDKLDKKYGKLAPIDTSNYYKLNIDR